MAANYAARRQADVERLVLFNPLLDYKQRFVDQKDFWRDEYLTDEADRALAEQSFLPHSPTFKLSRALLNEVFWLDARGALADIQAPTLVVHGTKDTFIPVESSRDADRRLTAPHQLLEIEGAQHGFAVHEDPTYANPQSQAWQVEVIAAVRSSLTG